MKSRGLFAGFSVTTDQTRTVAEQIDDAHLALEIFIIASPQISQYLSDLPKGPESSCPASPPIELAKFMAYRLGDVDWSDNRVLANFLETVMTPVLDERHELVFNCFAGQDLEVLWAAADVADAVSALYLAWLRRMVVPWNDLPADRQARFKQVWKGWLPKYDYSVYSHELLRLDDRVAWASAFPKEIAEVADRLDELYDLIDDEATRVYLDALMDAYEETDITKLEERWARVDEKWILIAADSKFVIIHGMENYEHPHGVSPEFRLVMRVTNAEQASEIAAFRAGTQARLTQYGLSDKAQQAARDKLNNLDVGVFMSLIEGGVCLRKRLAGQVVPNRQAILARGGKAMLAVAQESYVKMLADKVRQNCTPETAITIIPLLSTVGNRRLTVGHEFFHPVGCTPETEALLGPAYKLLEEAKATIGGLVVNDDLDSSLEARRRSAAACIARILRFMHKSRLGDSSVSEYVRENLVLLNYLLGNDVIGIGPDNGGIAVNLNEEALDAFFESLRVVAKSVIKAYQGLDVASLEHIRVGCCGPDDRGASPEAKAIIAWVNRE